MFFIILIGQILKACNGPGDQFEHLTQGKKLLGRKFDAQLAVEIDETKAWRYVDWLWDDIGSFNSFIFVCHNVPKGWAQQNRPLPLFSAGPTANVSQHEKASITYVRVNRISCWGVQISCSDVEKERAEDTFRITQLARPTRQLYFYHIRPDRSW